MSSVTDASNWVTPLKGQMAPARRSSAVLVVDDEPGMRNFLRKALEQECALVEAADSVETAEELRQRYHFDLLIVDIRLPGRSGVEWLAELRERPAIEGGESRLARLPTLVTQPLFYAAGLPLLHLAAYFGDFAAPSLRGPREMLLLAILPILAGLAMGWKRLPKQKGKAFGTK